MLPCFFLEILEGEIVSAFTLLDLALFMLVSQSWDQSINQSVSQSVNQSMHVYIMP